MRALRDANARARFSVGNNFGADSRKTFRADAMCAAARQGIAAHAAGLRFVPRADALEPQPKGRRRPQREGVEKQPEDRVETLLGSKLRVETDCAVFPKPEIKI
jgi:hypothetical protein